MTEVWITGAGTVNALGPDVATTLDAMAAGRVGIGPLDIPEVDRLSVRIGAAVPGWDPEARFTRQDLTLFDRATQFAVVAGAQAMAQAGLPPGAVQGPRLGVVMGTAGGGNITQNDAYRAVYAEGRNRVHPLSVPKLMHPAAAAHLAMQHGAQGPVFCVSTACAASNHAIGLALQMLRLGAADVMLAGGAEAMLSFGGLKVWEGLRVMSPDGCRPFCATRNGMVQGEGAAVFVLESAAHARARGARPLARLAGFAMGSDAADIVMPSVEGATRVMQAALADAGLSAGDIGYVNAHGTATLANDRTEAAAIRAVLGDGVPVSSTKSMHGHLIGATGAVELLAGLLALAGTLAPTAGHVTPDPEIGLDVIPNTARPARVEAVLSNAFAFGGMNACLVLTRA